MQFRKYMMKYIICVFDENIRYDSVQIFMARIYVW